MLAKNNKFV